MALASPLRVPLAEGPAIDLIVQVADTIDGDAFLLQHILHFIEDPSVVHAGFSALWVMMLQQNNAHLLTALGALGVLRSAMARHVADVPVQLIGCKLLRALAGPSLSRVDAQGIVCTIVCAMRHHPTAAEMQAAACDALQRLTGAEGGRTELPDEGLDPLLDALRRHPLHLPIQHAGLAVLRNLSSSPHGRRRLLHQGGVCLVVGAMRLHPHDPVLQQRGLHTLLLLTAHPNDRASLVQADGVSAVTSSLRHHPADTVVQRCGIALLWQLSATPEYCMSSNAMNCLEIIAGSQQQHKADVPIQFLANAVLQCSPCCHKGVLMSRLLSFQAMLSFGRQSLSPPVLVTLFLTLWLAIIAFHLR